MLLLLLLPPTTSTAARIQSMRCSLGRRWRASPVVVRCFSRASPVVVRCFSLDNGSPREPASARSVEPQLMKLPRARSILQWHVCHLSLKHILANRPRYRLTGWAPASQANHRPSGLSVSWLPDKLLDVPPPSSPFPRAGCRTNPPCLAPLQARRLGHRGPCNRRPLQLMGQGPARISMSMGATEHR